MRESNEEHAPQPWLSDAILLALATLLMAAAGFND